jgi:hypothetical protein
MSQPIIPPPAAAMVAADLTKDEQDERVDPDDARDVEDATPVGEADRDADIERSTEDG